MRNKYIFSNMIGTFVFNEHFNIIKSIMFRNNDDFKNKDRFEKEFLKKYKEIKRPNEDELKRILSSFKGKEFFKEFHSKNLSLTKKLVKDAVKDDILVIQAINNIADIDKVINTLSKRLRDWYELFNPEFSKKVEKHDKFVELILDKKDTKIKGSMGADLSKTDLRPIMDLARGIDDLFELRGEQEEYLGSVMKRLCPNMLAITGVTIGAKLLGQAGSMKKLVTFPASTIQLLGAEKALFRHLKTKARSPKYGFLHEHPLIMKNKKSIHGKIARTLADKISIAVKVDYFKGKFIGETLRKDIEKKFKN